MKSADAPTLRDFMAGAEPEAGSVAYAGVPLPEGCGIASREAVIDALRTVCDPEIPVNIYDLGLIYRLDIGMDGKVSIDMTLTAPACPVAGAMPRTVAKAVAAVAGVGEVDVELVWEPPWSRDRMTDDARLALDLL
ncbi:MAG: SUF system Fe-S cluster assembly protein [Burkholderiaceae bacterium]